MRHFLVVIQLQFLDLMHIFRRLGFPSETNWYLFNGDFVDRGDCGVEVSLTIFGWHQVYPNAIFLNRGNHEERSVHSMHGFQQVAILRASPCLTASRPHASCVRNLRALHKHAACSC